LDFSDKLDADKNGFIELADTKYGKKVSFLFFLSFFLCFLSPLPQKLTQVTNTKPQLGDMSQV
jgi:hypothetical protein